VRNKQTAYFEYLHCTIPIEYTTQSYTVL